LGDPGCDYACAVLVWPAAEARPTRVKARAEFDWAALVSDLSACAKPPVALLHTRAEVNHFFFGVNPSYIQLTPKSFIHTWYNSHHQKKQAFISYNSHHKSSAQNEITAPAPRRQRVARRPEVASKEKTRPPPVSDCTS